MSIIIKGQTCIGYTPYVVIGNQAWTRYNLNVDTYRNGDSIPQVTDSTQWVNLTTGAWCWYNNDSANGAVYGKLYNWYAVNDPRGLAPAGYHIPSQTEWNTLKTVVGSRGGDLKQTGTAYWTSPNTGATNVTGFTGLPGGYRQGALGFGNIKNVAYFWTSTVTGNYTYAYNLVYNTNSLPNNTYGPSYGLSVRCIKD